MPFYSPLRYPGGKGRLANFVKLVFRWNDLLDGEYVEPYAGGAGVALALLFEEYASHVHINDLNRSIYALWHCVLYETDALCRRIEDTEVSIEEWYRQRAEQERADECPLFELGFSTFFLNRTNRSGIIWGGVIGGKDQSGTYKLDARYNKEGLICRIRRIGRYRDRISIYNRDAVDLIKDILPTVPGRSLVYLDPPYYVKGQGLYEDYYEHGDHVELRNVVAQIDQNWVVTYDKAREIMDLYKGYRSMSYGLHYSAADRYEGSEVMFFCDKLRVPAVENPTKVSVRVVNDGQAPFAV